MSTLALIDALICGALCLRVLFFRRDGAVHRPLAAFIAWIIIAAAGGIALLGMFGCLPDPTPAGVVLHGVLCLAVFATRGNVTELFRSSEAENCIHKLIRRTRHAQG